MYDLVTNLGPENYEILVAVGTDGNGLFTKMLEARRIKTRIIKNLRRSIRPGYDFKAIKEVRNLITEFIPDILFLNSPKAGVIGSLAARKFPLVKVIYRNGGWAFNDPAPWLVRWLYIGIEKFTANYKDHIIVNNQKEFEDAKRLKIKPRISLEKIYNGILAQKLDFLPRELAREELNKKFAQDKLTAKTKVVGLIANFYGQKGIADLIQAATEFKNRADIKVVIIGDGMNRAKFEKMISHLNLEDQVFLTGTLENAYRVLKAFDIFAFPSHKEGFPWAVLEAMAAKLPIIATPVGAIPEMITDQENGLIVPVNRPRILGRKILSLIESDRDRLELGIQAHQTVLFKFSQETMLKKIEGFLA